MRKAGVDVIRIYGGYREVRMENKISASLHIRVRGAMGDQRGVQTKKSEI